MNPSTGRQAASGTQIETATNLLPPMVPLRIGQRRQSGNGRKILLLSVLRSHDRIMCKPPRSAVHAVRARSARVCLVKPSPEALRPRVHDRDGIIPRRLGHEGDAIAVGRLDHRPDLLAGP